MSLQIGWLAGWLAGLVDGLALPFTSVPFPSLSLSLLKVSPIDGAAVRTINQMEVKADGDGDDGE